MKLSNCTNQEAAQSHINQANEVKDILAEREVTVNQLVELVVSETEMKYSRGIMNMIQRHYGKSGVILKF